MVEDYKTLRSIQHPGECAFDAVRVLETIDFCDVQHHISSILSAYFPTNRVKLLLTTLHKEHFPIHVPVQNLQKECFCLALDTVVDLLYKKAEVEGDILHKKDFIRFFRRSFGEIARLFTVPLGRIFKTIMKKVCTKPEGFLTRHDIRVCISHFLTGELEVEDIFSKQLLKLIGLLDST